MKWHIINATQLFEKHLRESDIWFQNSLLSYQNLLNDTSVDEILSKVR